MTRARLDAATLRDATRGSEPEVNVDAAWNGTFERLKERRARRQRLSLVVGTCAVAALGFAGARLLNGPDASSDVQAEQFSAKPPPRHSRPSTLATPVTPPRPSKQPQHTAAGHPPPHVGGRHNQGPAREKPAQPHAPAPASGSALALPVPDGANVAVGEAQSRILEAQGLWRAGRAREAAALYELVVRRFPNDPRAGFATFELARLRMDKLADLPGAVESLQRALAVGTASGFHEDALARFVQATDRLGRLQECRSARDLYLATYTSGVHARVVAASCVAPSPSGAPE